MKMFRVISLPFKILIILNIACFVSCDFSSQPFTLYKSLGISTNAADITEIASDSAIHCASVCILNNVCHRASYDIMTKKCRIYNDQTNRNCDVWLDVIQTSLFLRKVGGKFCNF